VVNRTSPDGLRQNLLAVDAAIAAHPLASEPVTRAHAVIDEFRPAGKEAVAQELADRGLPGLVTLGTITVRESLNWGRLHRDRKKLMKRIDRLSR